MLRFTFNGTCIEVEDKEATLRLLEFNIESQNRANAEQQALSVVYRVGGEPDPSRPWNGLLTERLAISEKTARMLITEGLISYLLVGEKKGYRVTEGDVREYERKNRKQAA